MDSSKLVEQALRALQASSSNQAVEFSNMPNSSTTSVDSVLNNALAHLIQTQTATQNSSSLPNSNNDSSSSPAPSNTPPGPENNTGNAPSMPSILAASNTESSALTNLYNSLLTPTPETSTPLAQFSNSNIGSANRNKLAKRDPTNLAENEKLALINKRASDRKAAQKYRRKKKLEMDLLVSENAGLKDRVKELEGQLEQASTAIRLLSEQVNNEQCNRGGVEEKMNELLKRNAELEKSASNQSVIEELLSQYAKSQAAANNAM